MKRHQIPNILLSSLLSCPTGCKERLSQNGLHIELEAITKDYVANTNNVDTDYTGNTNILGLKKK